MRPSNLNTAIIVALSGVVATLGLVYAFALPAYRESVQTGIKLVETESQVQAQYNSRKKLSETTDRIRTARNIIEKLKAQFLPNGSELELITDVEGIGDKQGVVTKLTLNLNDSGSASESDKSFTLSVTGPYAKVLNALIDFERLPFLASYSSLTLSSGDNADSPLTMELRGSVAGPPKNL